MKIIIKRTAIRVLGLTLGKYAWKFPTDYNYFEVSYNDLTHILETNGFEIVKRAPDDERVLFITASNSNGGIIGES